MTNFEGAERMKRIRYRGGILEFSIPADWVEEVGDEGAAYYRDQPGTGTLRLHVITARPPGVVTSNHVIKAAAPAAAPGDAPPELLPNGNALRSYWRDGKEAKAPVRIR